MFALKFLKIVILKKVIVDIYTHIGLRNLYKYKCINRYLCCCLVTKLCLTVTPGTIARQTPLSMGFPGQEYWSGLPFPSPMILKF